MLQYEVVTFATPVGATAKCLPAIAAYMTGGNHRGTLRACWYSDIGALNEIMVIREFASDAERAAERERMVADGNPFGIGDFANAMTVANYTLFPFLPAIGAGNDGPFYEVRSYTLRPSGLAPTIEAWQVAVPTRVKLSPLVAAMYTVDGAMPGYLHIWPWKSLDERSRVRAAAVEAGVWPPKGGPDHILTMRNSIFIPAAFSPLQ